VLFLLFNQFEIKTGFNIYFDTAFTKSIIILFTLYIPILYQLGIIRTAESGTPILFAIRLKMSSAAEQ